MDLRLTKKWKEKFFSTGRFIRREDEEGQIGKKYSHERSATQPLPSSHHVQGQNCSMTFGSRTPRVHLTPKPSIRTTPIPSLHFDACSGETAQRRAALPMPSPVPVAADRHTENLALPGQRDVDVQLQTLVNRTERGWYQTRWPIEPAPSVTM